MHFSFKKILFITFTTLFAFSLGTVLLPSLAYAERASDQKTEVKKKKKKKKAKKKKATGSAEKKTPKEKRRCYRSWRIKYSFKAKENSSIRPSF